ncbi:hypothetical protein FOQG_09868 [Fusarium oxysporum f. sp. raphani 54005]|uniref:Uncharacterized protein n=2 Tax=Fusarium oxysporum TaxID=5507 RepID=X0CUJ5_FUSOX|nr:hypothetical protein FOQG_09868 [Fusarium oxysporum f. sp. raphani 54005]EXL78742.1 hypothetical protein FOPG_07188 [Fusarium oxysporum f. sp. conglutinans race 2 54008]
MFGYPAEVERWVGNGGSCEKQVITASAVYEVSCSYDMDVENTQGLKGIVSLKSCYCPEILASTCWSKYSDCLARYHSFTSPISRDKSNKNTSSSAEELKTL